jgi:hypothetical protein
MKKDKRKWKFTTDLLRQAYDLPGVRSLVLSNLAVLAVLLFFKGDICWLMKVYWWEMAVVWLFSMLKAVTVSPYYAIALFLPSALATGFVMLIYMIIAAEVGQCQAAGAALWKDFMRLPLLTAIIPLVCSHGYSFLREFWPERAGYGGANADRNAKEFCFDPMHRVTFWMLVFITCCFVAETAGIKKFAYVFIIGFKTIADAFTLMSMSDTEKARAKSAVIGV